MVGKLARAYVNVLIRLHQPLVLRHVMETGNLIGLSVNAGVYCRWPTVLMVGNLAMTYVNVLIRLNPDCPLLSELKRGKNFKSKNIF